MTTPDSGIRQRPSLVSRVDRIGSVQQSMLGLATAVKVADTGQGTHVDIRVRTEVTSDAIADVGPSHHQRRDRKQRSVSADDIPEDTQVVEAEQLAQLLFVEAGLGQRDGDLRPVGKALEVVEEVVGRQPVLLLTEA